MDPSVYQRLQEFSASLVLADIADLSTFAHPLEILEALEAEPSVVSQPLIKDRLAEIRLALESLIMGQSEPNSSLQKIEHLLNSLMEQGEPSSQEGKARGEEQGPPPSEREDTDKAPLTQLECQEILVEFIVEAKERLSEVEVDLVQLESSPDDPESLAKILRAVHTLKGVSGFLNLKHFNTLCHLTEDLMDRRKQGAVTGPGEDLDLLFDALDLLKALVDHIELCKGEPEEGPLAQRWKSTTRMIKEAISTGLVGTLHATNDRTALSKGPSINVRPPAASHDQLVKVDNQKLTELLNLVGELVIYSSKLRHHPIVAAAKDPGLHNQLDQFYKRVSETRKAAMGLSMVPIKKTFLKMIRVVRDLEKRSGKGVTLELQGEETEVDRVMADRLFEPLVHIIRNAIDHGIEPPELRKEVGKPPEGKITLSAYHRGGQLIVRIEDDGRGLNRETILKRALEMNLISDSYRDEGNNLEDLIFSPGFSTSDKVTEISGRGVGMDAVQKTIAELGGSIDVKSRPGLGCAFTISLPIALTVVEGFVISLAGHKLVIPMGNVKESAPLEENMCIRSGERLSGVILSGHLYPVVDWQAFLADQGGPPETARGILLILEHEGRFCALVADDILDKQEVVIKPLHERLFRLRYISSGAILGDGKVGWLVDVPSLIAETGT